MLKLKFHISHGETLNFLQAAVICYALQCNWLVVFCLLCSVHLEFSERFMHKTSAVDLLPRHLHFFLVFLLIKLRKTQDVTTHSHKIANSLQQKDHTLWIYLSTIICYNDSVYSVWALRYKSYKRRIFLRLF